MSDKVSVSAELINRTIQYLSRQPYADVYRLIAEWAQTAKDIPHEHPSEKPEQEGTKSD